MINLSYEQLEEIGYKYVRDQLEPVCPYGVKHLKQEGFYGPGREAELEEELDNVALLISAWEEAEGPVRDLQHALSYLKDLSGSFSRLTAGEPLGEVELFELSAFCRRMQTIKPLAEKLPGYGKLHGLHFDSPEGPLAVLDPAGSGRQSFYVEDERTPALGAARREKQRLELALRQAEGQAREELLQQRQEAVLAEEKALQEIYAAISRDLNIYGPDLLASAAAAGRLDACLAKADLARRYGCVRPRVGGESLILEDAMHLPAALAMEERGHRFTPLSMELPRGVTVLTGANMGGKSLALKTALLNTCLALGACFVFARKAQVPLFDRIALINRDFSNASQGLSSFGGEILRLKEVLEELDQGGLTFLVMDELARGTNAREGAAIARGTVRYLSDKNAVTFLATHYDGAGEDAARHYQVKGLQKVQQEPRPSGAHFRDGLRQIEQAMDYGLTEVPPGTECPKDAITICRLLGLPEEIIDL